MNFPIFYYPYFMFVKEWWQGTTTTNHLIPNFHINQKLYSYHHFLEKNRRKVLIIDYFFKEYNFSKATVKATFVSQSNVILAFIWSKNNNSQLNICCDMMFPKIHSRIFWWIFLRFLSGNWCKITHRNMAKDFEFQVQ